MTEPVIEVKGLSKSFPRQSGWLQAFRQSDRKNVLRGLDLTVRRGEVFGLLGPNGAGKTTLIKILAGLVLPDGGSATVNGFDVVRQSLQVRHSIGVVYGDERSFSWRISITENLRFYASIYGVPRSIAEARIDQLLELVGLADAAHVRMHSFSAGMKQRGAIARGLINDPPIIIMDEPSRTLDPIGSEELYQLMRERVANKRRTVLLATNHMSEAEALCDRLTLIDNGTTLLTGTIGDFRAHTAGEVTYRLVVSSHRDGWEDGLAAIPGVGNVLVQRTGYSSYQIQLTIDQRESALPLAIRYLIEQWGDIHSCTKEEITLEQIFRKVVRERRLQAAGAEAK